MSLKRFVYLLLLLTMGELYAQAPQNLQYSATLRGDAGELLKEVSMELRASVIRLEQGEWVTKYAETHNVTTTNLGGINLYLGNGIEVTNTFSSIDWSEGAHFIRVERIDTPTEILLADTELLAVPYAFYADVAGTIAEEAVGPNGLQGPPGADGPIGDLGPEGSQGPTGPRGAGGGPSGANGVSGASGPSGPQGPPGPASANTPNGASGAPGPTGPLGSPGPAGVGTGAWQTTSDGDQYLPNLSNSIILNSPDGNCWKLIMSDVGVAKITSIACP